MEMLCTMYILYVFSIYFSYLSLEYYLQLGEKSSNVLNVKSYKCDFLFLLIRELKYVVDDVNERWITAFFVIDR